MFCKDGYDVLLGRNFEEMLICDDSGKWFLYNFLFLFDCLSIYVFVSFSIFLFIIKFVNMYNNLLYFRVFICKVRYLQNGCFVLF